MTLLGVGLGASLSPRVALLARLARGREVELPLIVTAFNDTHVVVIMVRGAHLDRGPFAFPKPPDVVNVYTIAIALGHKQLVVRAKSLVWKPLPVPHPRCHRCHHTAELPLVLLRSRGVLRTAPGHTVDDLGIIPGGRHHWASPSGTGLHPPMQRLGDIRD